MLRMSEEEFQQYQKPKLDWMLGKHDLETLDSFQQKPTKARSSSRSKKPPAASEAQILKAIYKFMLSKHLAVYRINTMGVPVWSSGHSFSSFHKAPNTGMADLVVFDKLDYNGVILPLTIWLEVKTVKGKQTKSQKLFERQVELVHGFYYVVRSIEEAEQAIEGARNTILTRLTLFYDPLRG